MNTLVGSGRFTVGSQFLPKTGIFHALGAWVFCLLPTAYCLLSSCAHGPKADPRALLYVQNGSVLELDPDAFLESHPLPADKNIQPDLLGSDGETSYHVVQIRDTEVLHTHDLSDLKVIVIRGKGTLQLGGEKIPLKLWSSVRIPKGTPHAFINEGSDPAAAFVMFSPPITAGDMKPVPSSAPSP